MTLKDIGSSDTIRAWSQRLGATVTEMRLESQFRCQGSDAYLAWLDNTLGIRETANTTLEDFDYDFPVFDCLSRLREAIEAKNNDNGARWVAGYCWKWKSKKAPSAWGTPADVPGGLDDGRVAAWRHGTFEVAFDEATH